MVTNKVRAIVRIGSVLVTIMMAIETMIEGSADADDRFFRHDDFLNHLVVVRMTKAVRA